MIVQIHGSNVPEAYSEAFWAMSISGEKGKSRNGPVISIPSPVYLTIKYPWERVLFDPVRDANPFFHVMEFIWMMAGSNDAKWISQFNRRMITYADDGILRGAYGWRWQNPVDQLTDVITLLRRDPDTRQAVLSMWNPLHDGAKSKSSDRPCNTQIYFRSGERGLDMTVINRSNDLVWGMLGANAVHMTMLHELVSLASGFRQGEYRVFTNNLHVYPDMPRYKEIAASSRLSHNAYKFKLISGVPLLRHDEDWVDFRKDCQSLVLGSGEVTRTYWMENVGEPMYRAYLDRDNRDQWVSEIEAEDWQLACQEWCARRAAVL